MPGAVAVVVGLVALLQTPAAPLTGRAEIIDGDTLRIGATRIRLTGLDAPELDQTCAGASGSEWSCGMEAKSFAVGVVGQGPVTCLGSGRDRYGRMLAKCAVAGGDLGQAIVAAGWAVADRDYVGEEAAARDAKRGIWAGTFIAPAEWRRNHGADRPGFWEAIRAWFG